MEQEKQTQVWMTAESIFFIFYNFVETSMWSGMWWFTFNYVQWQQIAAFFITMHFTLQGLWLTFIESEGSFGNMFLILLTIQKWLHVPFFLIADMFIAYVLLAYLAYDDSQTDDLAIYVQRFIALLIFEVLYTGLLFMMQGKFETYKGYVSKSSNDAKL